MDRTEEIRERAEKATDGPWATEDVGSESIFGQWIFVGAGEYEDDMSSYKPPGIYVYAPFDEPSRADAEFAAHSRSDIPYLLERVNELEAALEPIVYDSQMKRERWALWHRAKEALGEGKG